MKNLWFFLFVFAAGIAVIVLELTVFNEGLALLITGCIIAIGGAVGACVYSKRARTFFGWVLDFILSFV